MSDVMPGSILSVGDEDSIEFVYMGKRDTIDRLWSIPEQEFVFTDLPTFIRNNEARVQKMTAEEIRKRHGPKIAALAEVSLQKASYKEQ